MDKKVTVLDGAGVSEATMNSDFYAPMNEDTKRLVWGVINENTQLQQENYFLKTKLKQIEKLVTNWEIYE